jgi:hypothetical protein
MTTILEEANDIIFGARNSTYGHPRENFANTASLWGAYLGQELSDQDVANLMILFKVSRVSKGRPYHRDSYVDIAGYAGTAERLQEPQADWERELMADDTTWVVDGRRYWSVWSEIPKDTEINSSDETDDTVPWSATGDEESFGVGPWREFIDQDVTVEVVPAQWKRLRRVPVGVTVLDKDDDKWVRVRGGVRIYNRYVSEWGEKLSLESADQHDMFGPFTEAVE